MITNIAYFVSGMIAVGMSREEFTDKIWQMRDEAFGFVGALIMDAQPEHVEWKTRINDCVNEMKRAGR